MKLYYYDNNGYYIAMSEAFLDPLETKLQGKNVWLMPPNATTIEPPSSVAGHIIKFNGKGWELEKMPDPEPELEPTLEELKSVKISELKSARDIAEVAPIKYAGNTYDFDTMSRDRLDIALKALMVQGEGATIDWTMADNTTATITAADIMAVFVASAVRSNELHDKYRAAKEKVIAAQNKEELGTIWRKCFDFLGEVKADVPIT